MCIYIGIEDLAANALIELIENSGKKYVLFRELDDYGACVIKILNEQGKQAMLLLSKRGTHDFLHDYSDYFEMIHTETGDEGIQLREGISVQKLWEKFRGYLTVDVMKAFMNRQAVQALGV